MEDKIEVGEYVRTKKGQIDKFEKLLGEDDKETSIVVCKEKIFWLEDIVKHSKNIINLIEVGDLIELNGAERLKYEVLKISWSKSKGKHIHIINPLRTEGGKDIFIEDIKSIVTKEQFNSIKYEIKED